MPVTKSKIGGKSDSIREVSGVFEVAVGKAVPIGLGGALNDGSGSCIYLNKIGCQGQHNHDKTLVMWRGQKAARWCHELVACDL